MMLTTTSVTMIAIRCTALVGLLVVAGGCETMPSVAPTRTKASDVASIPPPTLNFPPQSGPSRTFLFDRGLAYPNVQNSTKASRFVLYDDGAFVLQYAAPVNADFRGGYTEANGVLTFQFEGSFAWRATGAETANSLSVQYNEIMQGADFEDAVYALEP